MGIFSGLKTLTATQKTAQEKEQTKGNPYADVIMFSGIIIFNSGCKDSQTSADAHLEGQATGAMSYSLIKALKMYPNISYGQLLLAVRQILAQQFHQIPVLSSARYMDMNQRFQI
jgi:metacaspase-1